MLFAQPCEGYPGTGVLYPCHLSRSRDWIHTTTITRKSRRSVYNTDKGNMLNIRVSIAPSGQLMKKVKIVRRKWSVFSAPPDLVAYYICGPTLQRVFHTCHASSIYYWNYRNFQRSELQLSVPFFFFQALSACMNRCARTSRVNHPFRTQHTKYPSDISSLCPQEYFELQVWGMVWRLGYERGRGLRTVRCFWLFSACSMPPWPMGLNWSRNKFEGSVTTGLSG